jgi:hypothetical protein
LKASVYQAEGNLEQAGRLVAGVNAQTPSVGAFLTKINQLFLERHFDEAIRLIHSRLTEYRDLSDSERLFDQFSLVLSQQYAGDLVGARATAKQKLIPLETLSQKDPDNGNFAYMLSLTRAVLGQKDAAIKEAERAITLTPSGKDAVVGPFVEENLASVEVLVGDKNRAIPRLQRLLDGGNRCVRPFHARARARVTRVSATVPLNPAAFWQGCHSVGLWYGDPNTISYAKFYSRSHDAVIRVYDEAG